MATQFRDVVAALSPSWLRGPVASKMMYTFGLGLDLLSDKLDQAARMPMPGYGNASALPFIGADRSTPQGITESSTSYIARLKAWLDTAQHAGSAWGVLQGVLSYLLAYAPGGLTVSNSSSWDWYLEGNGQYNVAPTHKQGFGNWNWDGNLTAWWRMWVVLFAGTNADNSWTSNEGTWGDGDLWGPGSKSWGLSVPYTQIASMRAVVKQLKGAHTWVPWIVVSFSNSLFVPTAAAGGGVNPDGTWGYWYKIVNNQYVASRAANARYCDGAL